MPVIPQKLAFNAGELGPLVDARLDLDKYRFGCKQLQNFWPTVEGPVEYRPGLCHVGYTKGQSNPVRLEPFIYSETTRFVLEIGLAYIRVWAQYEQVNIDFIPSNWVGGGTNYVRGDYVIFSGDGFTYYCLSDHASDAVFANDLNNGLWVKQDNAEVPTDYTVPEIYELDLFQINDVVYFAHPDFPFSKLTRVSNGTWTFAAVDWDYPPLLPENATAVTITPTAATGNTYIQASSAIFDKDHEGSYWAIKHRVKGLSVELELYTSDGVSAAIEMEGDWTVKTTERWLGTLTVQRSYDGGATWEDIRDFESDLNRNIEASGTQSIRAKLRLKWTKKDGGDPYNASANAYWQKGTVPTTPDEPIAKAYLEADEAYLGGFLQITSVNTTLGTPIDGTGGGVTDVAVTIKQDLYAATATKYWSEGAFSDHRGHARTVTLFDGRLTLGGHTEEPKGIYGSVIDDFENFKYGSLDDDGLNFNIVGRRNVIQWLAESSGKLFAGTLGEEVAISGGGVDEPLTPTSVKAKGGTYYGSARLPAVNLNDVILFVQQGGRFVRELVYNWEKEGYQATDLTRLARHICGTGIFDVGVSRNPYQIWWACRNDGQLIGMLFERNDGVVSWFRTVSRNKPYWMSEAGWIDAEFESVCTIPDDNGNDEVWVSVKRDISSGEIIRTIERFSDGSFTDLQSAIRLDQCASVENAIVSVSGITRTIIGDIDFPVEARTWEGVYYTVTTAVAHGLSTEDTIRMRAPVWPELDGKQFRVVVKPEPDWVTLTDYFVGDRVVESGLTYLCLSDHTAGTFATDLANEEWILDGSANFYLIDPDPATDRDITAVTNHGPGIPSDDGLSPWSNTEVTIDPFTNELPQVVFIDGVVGMVELNGRQYVLCHEDEVAVNAGTYLDGVDSDAYTGYTSGGKVYRVPPVNPDEWIGKGAFNSPDTLEVLVNTIGGGYTYLKDESLSAMIDGYLYEGLTADAGHIALPVWGNKIKVGVPYNGIMETQKIEIPMDVGTSRGRLLNIIRIILSLKSSWGGYAGFDENRMTEIHRMSETDAMDGPAAAMTGEYSIYPEGSTSHGLSVFVKQTKPYPLTLLGLYPKTDPSDV